MALSTVELERLLVRIVGDATHYIGTLNAVQANTLSALHRITQMGRSFTYLITAPIVAFGTASFKAFAQFETSLARIEGLVGVPRERVEELSDAVLNMAGDIGKSPLELAEALYYVTSSGIGAQHSLGILTAAARASVAGLASTQVVADVVTSAINAYGIENLSAAKATDILIATIREGKAEGPQLARTLGRVLPPAAALGVTFDEIGASIAGMTRVAGAEIAVTQLRGILSTIIGPTEEAKRALKAANIGLDFEGIRQMIKDQGLLATLFTLRDAFPNIQKMEDVFGNVRAMTGMLQLMGGRAQDNAGIFARMRATIGDTDRAFEAISKTSAFKWQQAMAEIKVGMILMGKVLAPVADFISATVRRLAKTWAGLNDQTKRTVTIFASLFAVIGPVLLLLGYIGPTFLLGFTAIGQITGKIIAIAAIIGRFGILATTFAMIIQWVPMILGLASAVLLVVAYMGGFKQSWIAATDAGLLAMVLFEGIKRGFVELGNIIRDIAQGGWLWFMQFFNQNRELFDRVMTSVFVVGLLALAFKMLVASVVMTSAVLSALRVYQTAVLITYGLLIFTLARTLITMYVFNATLWVVNATVIAYRATLTFLTTSTVVSAIATKLATAAMAVYRYVVALVTVTVFGLYLVLNYTAIGLKILSGLLIAGRILMVAFAAVFWITAFVIMPVFAAALFLTTAASWALYAVIVATQGAMTLANITAVVSAAVIRAWAAAVAFAKTTAAALFTTATMLRILMTALSVTVGIMAIAIFPLWTAVLLISAGATFLVTNAVILLSYAFGAARASLIMTKVLLVALGVVLFTVGSVLFPLVTTAITVTMVAASALYWAIGIMTGVFSAANLMIVLNTIKMGVWAVAMALTKGVVWLLNAALTALNALIAPATIVAAIIAFGILTAIFSVLSAVVWGIFSAISAVFIAFSTLWDVVGPVGHITALFYKWWEVIQLVVEAAKVDMPLAWEIMQAGFFLAVAQIKAFWPPLWEFIKTGFAAVAKLVSDVFVIEFQRALYVMMRAMLSVYQSDAISWLVPGPVKALLLGAEVSLSSHIMELERSRRLAGELAAMQLGGASATFAGANFNTEEVRAAQARLETLRARLEEIRVARAAVSAIGGGIGMAALVATNNAVAPDPAATTRSALMMMGGAAGMAAAQMAGIEVMTPDEAEEARIRAEMARIGDGMGDDLGSSVNEAAKKEMQKLEGIVVGSLEDILVMGRYRELLAEMARDTGTARARAAIAAVSNTAAARAARANAVGGLGAMGAGAAAAVQQQEIGQAGQPQIGGGQPQVGAQPIGALLTAFHTTDVAQRQQMVLLMQQMLQHLVIMSTRAGGELLAADFG